MPRTGTGRIFQRGEQWWIDYSHRGKRYREPAGPRKKDATDLLKQRLGEIGRGKLVGPSAERVTLDDVLAMLETDYQVNARKSERRLRSTLAHLREFFGFARALDVTTDRIKQYIARRQEDGAANATIQQELAHLKRAFNLALQAQALPHKPHIPSVRVSNARKGFFEPGDFQRVLAELPEDVQPVAEFAAFTGWRRSEILSLTWAQVDFENGTVRLEPGTTKNDEGREFPFSALPPLAALLKRQRERTRVVEREAGQIIPWVFHRRGRPIHQIRGTWRSACERAGVPHALFHDLRRTAVRNLERAGVPRSVAMKLTGHKTEAVYRRYAIADHAALTEGVGKLAKLHAGPAEAPKAVPFQTRSGT